MRDTTPAPYRAATVILNGVVMTMDETRPTAEAVAIAGGRIVLVGDQAEVRRLIGGQTDVIDADGHVVAPGFIDIHTHADLTVGDAENRLAKNFAMQGITTIIGGNCGLSSGSTGSLIEQLDAAHPVVNVGVLVGHGFVRDACGVPSDQRRPTDAQLTRMKEMVAAAMGSGAFGLSTGLEYVPGLSSTTEEIVACAQVVAGYGGLYATHVRSEGDGLLGALEEAVRIADEAGVRAEISHIKADGCGNWWKSEAAVRLVEDARSNGVDVGVDQYPYTAYGWNPSLLVAPEDLAAGVDAVVARCRSSREYRARIVAAIADRLRRHYDGDGGRIIVYEWTDRDGRRWATRTLRAILAERGIAPSEQALAECIVDMLPGESADSMMGSVIGMDEESVRRFMRLPYAAVCTDAFSQPWLSPCHPRSYGAFPRVLGHYVRDQRVLDLELALAKMTSLPSRVMRLGDRGVLREGCRADVTIFDPATVGDAASFTAPAAPLGIEYVLVNGVPVVDRRLVDHGADGFVADRIPSGEAPGMVLRGPGHRP